jgi:hypothetical protein
MSRRPGLRQRVNLQDFASWSVHNRAGQLEVLTDSLYDIQTCAPETEAAHFFQVPVGGRPLVSKFSADRRHFDRTNMYLAGCLPAPQRFLIETIRIEVYCDGGTRERERAYGMVYAHGYLQLFNGSKVYHQGARLGNYMGFGYPLDQPLLIDPTLNFCTSLFWPETRLRKPVDIGIYLDGQRVRPSE